MLRPLRGRRKASGALPRRQDVTSHKKETTGLILALALVSLGGWLLHFRIHPVVPDAAGIREARNFVPFSVGLVSILLVPVLLWLRRTLILGYLLNGMGAVTGTVLMTYFSLTMLRHPVTLAGIFTGTILADVFIAFAKLFIGQRILLTYLPSGMGRMFTGWWWTRHFVYISVIFTLGHFIWRQS